MKNVLHEGRRLLRLSAKVTLVTAVAVLGGAADSAAGIGEIDPRFDHLQCVRITKDLRGISGAEMTLTPKQLDTFQRQTGCRIRPNRRPRARELCFAVATEPRSATQGPEIHARYVCYNIRCADRAADDDTISISDRFGSGDVQIRRRRGQQRLCVPIPDDPCAGKPEGATCDDADPSTSGEVCVSGQCADLCADVTCTALDQCHSAGTCDPATGLCSDPALPDGSACDDGDAGTSNDVCTSGTCGGLDLCAGVVCQDGDPQCQDPGVCSGPDGACSSPSDKPDGTACDDGDPSTAADQCSAGSCTGGTALACPCWTDQSLDSLITALGQFDGSEGTPNCQDLTPFAGLVQLTGGPVSLTATSTSAVDMGDCTFQIDGVADVQMSGIGAAAGLVCVNELSQVMSSVGWCP